MSEMVDRAARALCLSANGFDDDPEIWKRYRESARVVIEAMREPTEVMLDAVNPGHGPGTLIAGLPIYGADSPDDMWHAMIDAALKD